MQVTVTDVPMTHNKRRAARVDAPGTCQDASSWGRRAARTLELGTRATSTASSSTKARSASSRCARRHPRGRDMDLYFYDPTCKLIQQAPRSAWAHQGSIGLIRQRAPGESGLYRAAEVRHKNGIGTYRARRGQRRRVDLSLRTRQAGGLGSPARSLLVFTFSCSFLFPFFFQRSFFRCPPLVCRAFRSPSRSRTPASDRWARSELERAARDLLEGCVHVLNSRAAPRASDLARRTTRPRRILARLELPSRSWRRGSARLRRRNCSGTRGPCRHPGREVPGRARLGASSIGNRPRGPR